MPSPFFRAPIKYNNPTEYISFRPIPNNVQVATRVTARYCITQSG